MADEEKFAFKALSNPTTKRYVVNFDLRNLFDLNLDDIPDYVAKELKNPRIYSNCKTTSFRHQVTQIIHATKKQHLLDIDRLIVAHYRLYGGHTPRACFEEEVENLTRENRIIWSKCGRYFVCSDQYASKGNKHRISERLIRFYGDSVKRELVGHYSWLNNYTDSLENTKEDEVIDAIRLAITENRYKIYSKKEDLPSEKLSSPREDSSIDNLP